MNKKFRYGTRPPMVMVIGSWLWVMGFWIGLSGAAWATPARDAVEAAIAHYDKVFHELEFQDDEVALQLAKVRVEKELVQRYRELIRETLALKEADGPRDSIGGRADRAMNELDTEAYVVQCVSPKTCAAVMVKLGAPMISAQSKSNSDSKAPAEEPSLCSGIRSGTWIVTPSNRWGQVTTVYQGRDGSCRAEWLYPHKPHYLCAMIPGVVDLTGAVAAVESSSLRGKRVMTDTGLVGAVMKEYKDGRIHINYVDPNPELDPLAWALGPRDLGMIVLPGHYTIAIDESTAAGTEQ